MNIKTILGVGIFAIAFGFVEAAVVVYLRRIFGDPAQVIIPDGQLLRIEQVREAATIIMLIAVAFLAGKNIRNRIAAFFLAFGLWDIFYYVFLRLSIGWPKTLLDPDVFFLLPVPWLGPVIVPIIISLILVLGSIYYLITISNETEKIKV